MAHTHTTAFLLSNTPRILSPPSLPTPKPSTRFSSFHRPLLRFTALRSKPSHTTLVSHAHTPAMAAVEVFEKDELAASLAKYVADLSNNFTAQRGAFTVCLSGGSLISYL